jgi:hypothetical protein
MTQDTNSVISAHDCGWHLYRLGDGYRRGDNVTCSCGRKFVFEGPTQWGHMLTFRTLHQSPCGGLWSAPPTWPTWPRWLRQCWRDVKDEWSQSSDQP